MQDTSNVVRFVAPSAGLFPASQPDNSTSDVRWGIFTPKPDAPKKPWATSHARALSVAREKAKSAVEEVAPPQSPCKSLAEYLQEAAERPTPPLLDLSEQLKTLPPLDRVKLTLATLVPVDCLKTTGFIDFLNARASIKESRSRVQNAWIEILEQASGAESGEHIEDAKTLTATQLKEKYPLTHSTWRNMKARRHDKKKPAIIHPAFETFRDFFMIVGPRPSEEYTLDRKDWSDPEYGPEKVRWLDKKGQANNRSSTIMLPYRGEILPLTVVAEKTGQNPDTLRRRHREGWPDEEIVSGRRGAQKLSDHRPWNIYEDLEQWDKAEEFYQKNKLPNDVPFQFCLRLARTGLNPWQELLDAYVDPSREDFSGIAPQCVPQIKAAALMVAECAPVLQWLKSMWRGFQKEAARALASEKRKKSEKRRLEKETTPEHKVDLETAIQNRWESRPELILDEDDYPL